MKPYIELFEKFIGKMEVGWKEKTLLQSGMYCILSSHCIDSIDSEGANHELFV